MIGNFVIVIEISFCFGLVPCVIHLSFQSYCAFDCCHEVLVIWCNLLSTWAAKLNEQFTCCIWYNSDVAVKIILILQSCCHWHIFAILMRKIHNEEAPPQAPSSHSFLKVAFSSCFWLCVLLLMLISFSRSLLNPCPMSSCSVTGISTLTPFLLLTLCCHLFTCDPPCSQWKSVEGTFWNQCLLVVFQRLQVTVSLPPGFLQEILWRSGGRKAT